MLYALPLNLFAGMMSTRRDDVLAQGPVAGAILLSMAGTYAIVFAIARYLCGRDLMTSSLQALAIGGPAVPFVGVPVLGHLFGPVSAIPISVASMVMNLIQVPATLMLLSAGMGEKKVGAGGAPTLVSHIVHALREPVVWAPLAALVLVLVGVQPVGPIQDLCFCSAGPPAALPFLPPGLSCSRAMWRSLCRRAYRSSLATSSSRPRHWRFFRRGLRARNDTRSRAHYRDPDSVDLRDSGGPVSDRRAGDGFDAVLQRDPLGRDDGRSNASLTQRIFRHVERKPIMSNREIQKSVANLVISCLEAEGVDYMFGIPGEENIRLVVATADSKIRFILTRHEQAAAFMADVYGRITGKAGVCTATLGPGAINLALGVADAQTDSDAARGHHGAGGTRPNLQGVAPDCGCRFHVQAAHQVGRHSANSGRGAGNGPQSVRCRAIGAPGAAYLAIPEDIEGLPAPVQAKPLPERPRHAAAPTQRRSTLQRV